MEPSIAVETAQLIEDAKRMQFLVKHEMELTSCECEVEPYKMWCVVNRSKPNEGSVWHSHPYIAIDEARRKKGEL